MGEQLSEMNNLVRALQLSVAPCLLISGFGFLLLTMTNRLGRAADRIRELTERVGQASSSDKAFLKDQIAIIFRRCRFLQAAISLITFCILFVSVSVFVLFSSFLFGVNTAIVVQVLFALSVFSLILSLCFFFMDIRLTLKSLKIEIKWHNA